MDSVKLKKQLKYTPAKPGIYIFKDSRGKSLYIGKALNLKNRVSQYLKTSDARLQKMISESKKVDFIETGSDIEALILESQYIKKYQPAFNIMLRDDKNYFYVGFSDDSFSKISLTHQPNQKNWKLEIGNWKLNSANAEFLGPFTDGSAIKTTLQLLRRIFPYCTCKQMHNNYCLNYHIGKCMGFCCLKKPVTSNQQITTYAKNIKAIKDILSGNKSSPIKDLEKEMKTLSVKQEFEKAMELQYKIEKLKRVFQNAQILNTKYLIRNTKDKEDNVAVLKQLAKIVGTDRLPSRIEAYDIANIQGKHAVGSMAVFTEGQSDINQYRKFKISNSSGGDTGMLQEIITRRFNHPEWPTPDLIIVDGGKQQLNAAIEVLSIKNYVLRIPIIALTKNEFHIGHKIMLKNGKEIFLSKLPSQIKNLLLNIDSEAHRFAISYYRKLHRKSI